MSMFLWFVLACISYAGVKLYRMFKVPREISDLPAIPIYLTLPSMLRGEPFDVRYNKFYRPVLEKFGVARAWNQGQWEIVVDNPQQVRSILSKPDVFLKQRPGDEINKKLLIRKTIGLETIVNTDGDSWRRHRRVANPAFKRTWPTKIFTECTDELIQKILTYHGQPIVVQDLFQKLTLDALGRGIFSYDFQAMQTVKENYNLKLYNEVIGAAFDPLYLTMPFLENMTPSRRYLHRRGQEFRQFLKSIIQVRKKEVAAGSDNDDLLSMMIRASDNSERGLAKLSDDDVVSDLGTFFIAGHDTTANTLSSMFYYLSKHPEIQERARREVLAVLGESDQVVAPTTEQLKAMPYIECIIKENMRCVTTAPQLRRYCAEATELPGGLIIPKDFYVNLQSWGIHHDPTLYKLPEVFDPDRFADPHSPEGNQWMAFGSGSRMCIGKNFSLIEQRIALVMLLQKFTFTLGPKSIDQKLPQLSVSGLLHPVNLEVLFTPRL